MKYILALIFTLQVAYCNDTYEMYCMGCHSPNPSEVGPVGPQLNPSSLELIRLKVTKGKYPKGYKPRRSTQMMPQFSLSKEQIKSLFEYVNK